MGYATNKSVENILASALTGSTTKNQELKILNKIGSEFDRNVISEDITNQYIIWADEEINGAISELYSVPLCEKADVEFMLLSDIDEYNDTIELGKAYVLVPGDVLVFIDGSQEERHVVDTLINNTTIEVEQNLIGFYSENSARVLRVKFSEPISLISARLAAGNIYDKFFAGQVSPNVSDYGNNLRRMAIRDLNNILNGRTILRGQKRTGNRFFNSNLRDRYELPAVESDGTRNIEQAQ